MQAVAKPQLSWERALAAFSGACTGIWITHHVNLIIISPLLANSIRKAAGIPLIPYDLRNLIELGFTLPSNWPGVLYLSAIMGTVIFAGLRWTRTQNLLVATAMAVSLFIANVIYYRMYPVQGSEFGLQGYIISLLFFLAAQFVVVAMSYGMSGLLLRLINRLERP